MSPNAEMLRESALKLDPVERAQLAAVLLASLDTAEADVEAAWATEIARRASDAIRNPEDEEDWRLALAEIEKEVLSR